MSVVVSTLLIIQGITGNGILGMQSDWSGGAGYPGPVPQWTDLYSQGSKIDISVPGQIGMIPDGEAASFAEYSTIIDNISDVFSVSIADADGDGDQDVATGSWSGTVSISLNSSAGSSWTTTVIDASAGSPTFISFGEFDGDGKPDLLTCLFDEGKVIWYRNPLPETSWDMVTVADCSQPMHCLPWDPDGDGDDDILCTSFGNDGLLSFQNLDGTGLNWSTVQIDPYLPSAQCVAFGDISGDGAPDVIASSASPGSVYWYSSPDWTKYPVAEGIGSVDDIELADIDGDGLIDAVIGSLSDHRTRWYRNPGVAGAEWESDWVTGDRTMAVLPADIDGDGDMDIICSNPLFDYFLAAMNLGTGHVWDIYQISPGISAFSDMDMADLNQDDIQDIVGASYYSSRSVWCAGSYAVTYPPISTLSSSILQCDSLAWCNPVFLEIDSEGDAVMRFRASDDASSMGPWSPELSAPSAEVTGFIEPGDIFCQYLISLRSQGDFSPSYAYGITLSGQGTGLTPETGILFSGPFPNPSQGSAEISVFLDQPSPVAMRCYDISGRLVQSVPSAMRPAGELRLTAGEFPPGLYLVRLELPDETFTCKLAVTR